MGYIRFNGVDIPVLPNIRGGPCNLDYCIASTEAEISIKYRSGEVTHKEGQDFPFAADVRFDIVLDRESFPGLLVPRSRDVAFVPDGTAYVAVSPLPNGYGVYAEMEQRLPSNLRQVILETGCVYLGRSGACTSLGDVVEEVHTANVERTTDGYRFAGWVEDASTSGAPE